MGLKNFFMIIGEKIKSAFVKIKNAFGWPWLITTAILCIASNLIWGLGGMFIVLGICCALRFIWAGINNISDKNRETADINRQTQQEAQKNNNEAELITAIMMRFALHVIPLSLVDRLLRVS